MTAASGNESRIGDAVAANVAQNGTVLLVSVSSFCAYSLFVFFNSWMPTYATEELGISIAAAGSAAALVPFAGIVARPGGGWISDRIEGRRRPVIVASFVLSLPLIVAISVATSPLAFAGLMLLTGASIQLAIGVYYVYASELAEPGTRGTCLAMVTSMSTFGALVAPAVGVAVLLWSGLKLFRGMDVAFSTIYRSPFPTGIVDQVRDGVVTLGAVGVGIAATVAIGALIAAPDISFVVGGVDLVGVLGTVALLAGLTGAFLPLYYVLPDDDVSVREALPGAAFAAVGWTALQTGFRYYTEFAGSYEAYGVLGAVLLLVTFLYFGGLVLLVGVVLNAVLADRIDETTDLDAPDEPDSPHMPDDDTSPAEPFDDRDYEDRDYDDRDDLEREVERLRKRVREFENDVDERTVHRDDLEADLKRYVRSRVRRGHARGWGPYLVLLYGTAMTIGAFFYLDSGAWAVAAMLVVWLSTLGLYVLMLIVGTGMSALGVPGRVADRVRSFRE